MSAPQQEHRPAPRPMTFTTHFSGTHPNTEPRSKFCIALWLVVVIEVMVGLWYWWAAALAVLLWRG